MNRFVCKFSEVAVTLDDRQNSLGFTGRHVLWQTRSPSIVNVSREFNSRTLGYFMTLFSFVHAARFVILSFFLCFASSLSDIRDFSVLILCKSMVCVRARVRVCELKISSIGKLLTKRILSQVVKVDLEVRDLRRSEKLHFTWRRYIGNDFAIW